jgi:hypothetical protein
MAQIPHDNSPDSTLALLSDGYLFISKRLSEKSYLLLWGIAKAPTPPLDLAIQQELFRQLLNGANATNPISL